MYGYGEVSYTRYNLLLYIIPIPYCQPDRK